MALIAHHTQVLNAKTHAANFVAFTSPFIFLHFLPLVAVYVMFANIHNQ